MPGVAALAVVVAPPLLFAAATGDGLPEWLDTVSRVGFTGGCVLAFYGLARRWWVPGWVHRDLEERHDRMRGRFDELVDVVVRSSRGVERSATVIEAALTRAERSG